MTRAARSRRPAAMRRADEQAPATPADIARAERTMLRIAMGVVVALGAVFAALLRLAH